MFNPQFWYSGPNFLGSQDLIDSLRTERLTAPQLFLAPSTRGLHKLVQGEIQVTQDPNTERRNLWISSEPSGASEYAIYGWFKWTHTAMQTWPNLFRVSQISSEDGSDLQNLNIFGDRTYCIWANPDGHIYPASYTSQLNGHDNWNIYVAKPYADDL